LLDAISHQPSAISLLESSLLFPYPFRLFIQICQKMAGPPTEEVVVKQPGHMISEYDDRDDNGDSAWAYSFAAAMAPFCAFLYGHHRGATGRVVEAVVRSPVGVYGLLALPFVTLGFEKSVYDTVQAAQGINPNVRPDNRGGFPSGGAELPSFSIIPIQKYERKNPVIQKD
jgi:hypothetical protein